MSILARLDEHGAHELALTVQEECGGPFDTPLVSSREVCVVCAAPRSRGFDTCQRCRHDRHLYGDRLADLVVPLTYAVSGRTGNHWMSLYKSTQADADRERRRLAVVLGRLLRVGLGLHRPCIETRLGREISGWASIPSTTGRTIDPHPLPAIAHIGGLHPPTLELGVHDPSVAAHALDENLFRARCNVDGRSVLVLDDTWVTGSRAQAAALALRKAGAAQVAVLILSRRLNMRYPETADFVRRHVGGDYDPAVCPVGVCTP